MSWNRSSNRSSNRRKFEQGVTLLELLVVMALASILLALVLPSIGAGMKTLEVESAARRIATAAKFARDQAIHQQKYFGLEIDAEKKTVSVTNIDTGDERSFELPDSVKVSRILPEEEASGENSEGASDENDGTARIFLFAPGGESPEFQIILEIPTRQVMVSSDPLTGFPKVSDL